MNLISRVVIALTAILALPAATFAVPLYNFANESGGAITDLGSSETLEGGIIGSAWYLNSGVWTESTLIARNEPGDLGLGVCSEGSDCNIGGTGAGDFNELSQLTYQEAILLQKPTGFLWTGLWVSSLDSGGTDNAEAGTLYWGNSSDIDTLLGGTGFNFAYGDLGAGVTEGSLSLPSGLASATYVLFVPNGTVGENNDYLVWGADLAQGDLPPVPEPASLMLLGSGLCAFAYKRARRR